MCKYCDGLPTDKDKENISFIESMASKEFILLGSYTHGYNQLKINYCPICGRNLNPVEPKEDEDDDIYRDDYSYEDIYGGYDPYSLGWDVWRIVINQEDYCI